MITRDDCRRLDAADRLAPLRTHFDTSALDAAGLIYLDGNSLGILPRAAAARIRDVVAQEWGAGLITSWNRAGWIDLPGRVGDRIARLIGAGPGEVAVTDSTSVNLFKALHAAAWLARRDDGRRVVLTERSNFPSDLYVAETTAAALGLELTLVETGEIAARLDARVAILLLTHVNYRTGRMHRMADLTRAAHAAGAVTIWDLAHSAGAVPVDLSAGGDVENAADLAIGCGYKYLNGGPGAPAFVWAHPRHTARMDREGWRQPLSGWLGHTAPFDFSTRYQPAPGIGRFQCGTPPILSLAALECGVEAVLAAGPLGGMAAIRAKSVGLANLFVDLVETRCAGHDLSLLSPRDSADRGSQICLAHPAGAYAIVQALIARGVIGDFRAPDVLRFGFTPLYLRFVDVWDAVDRLAAVLGSGEWTEARFTERAVVT